MDPVFHSCPSSPSTISSSTRLSFPSTTTSTIVGIGSLSGKAIKALGQLTLRGVEWIIIERRLSYIRSHSQHLNQKMHDDILELCRPKLYTANIKKVALQLILAQIFKGDVRRLITGLLKWPIDEMEIILNEITASVLSECLSLKHDTSWALQNNDWQNVKEILHFLYFLGDIAQTNQDVFDVCTIATSKLLPHIQVELNQFSDIPVLSAHLLFLLSSLNHMQASFPSTPQMKYDPVQRRQAWRVLLGLGFPVQERVTAIQKTTIGPGGEEDEDINICLDLVTLLMLRYVERLKSIYRNGFNLLGVQIHGYTQSTLEMLDLLHHRRSWALGCSSKCLSIRDLSGGQTSALFQLNSNEGPFYPREPHSFEGLAVAHPGNTCTNSSDRFLAFTIRAAERHRCMILAFLDSGIFALLILVLNDSLRYPLKTNYDSTIWALKRHGCIHQFPITLDSEGSSGHCDATELLKSIENKGVGCHLSQHVPSSRRFLWERVCTIFKISELQNWTKPVDQPMLDIETIEDFRQERPFAF